MLSWSTWCKTGGSRTIVTPSLYIHAPCKPPVYKNRQWKQAFQIVPPHTCMHSLLPICISPRPISYSEHEWFQLVILRNNFIIWIERITNPSENTSEAFPDLIWKNPRWDYGINHQKTNSTWSSNLILYFPAIITLNHYNVLCLWDILVETYSATL